ncbi:oligosaccharide flippase family protein [Natribacillus halophilus]|uniref:Membrane protein involved in the export of O-antigen and teichoic acid n=1 Tax=Natribacillus halophilus TaxID=549003 RepID=A0A1G8KGX3_9BACI|nr:oligosaccharide flippase family protein [Natribacillus halophilus]SDI42110.1 Membrane protein involved in the export of O-antigen and teichoic acid [Natribacillus halophilus]
MSKVDQLSLKENFSWNFIGSIIYSLSQFFIIIILAQMGNPVVVGLYSIGLAITTPIINLTNLQLRQIQATDTTAANYRFNDYFGLRILSGVIMLFITLLIVILSNYDIEKSIVVLLVGLTKVIDSYSDVTYGQLQQRERMDYIGKSRVIKGICTMIVMGITFYITGNLILSLIGINIVWLIIFLVYDKKNIKLFLKNVSPDFNLHNLKRLVLLALPLGIVLMLVTLNTNFPRIIVEAFLGEAALGYFASIAYLLVVGNTFIQSVGQAASPRMAKLYRNRELNDYKKIIAFLIVLGFSIGLVGFIVAVSLGEIILTLLYGSSYADYNQLLILVMIAGIFTFTSSFLGHGITAMRLFKIQPYANAISLMVTIITSFILIPIIGLNGAAYTLIIGSMTRFTLNLTVIFINLHLTYKRDIKNA